ncbi:hypothetical protein C1646_796198 [Rhizophagus diaphanus]|nr:hypothetical protein C1646_796198 [Rhizophagus diaphanus] [Rhizophagus sp. MUCL 43196]
MSENYARRGGGNPNSRKSSRQEKKAHKNSKFSDNSSSDELQETTQKRSYIINKNTMDEDFIADALADDGLDAPLKKIPKLSPPNNSTAPTTPSRNASSEVDMSIHAPSNKENNSSPNVSPDMDTNGGQSPNQAADPTPTITINRQDYQAAAALNSATETLKKFPTNKALIDAVNNLFLETYKSYTGHAKMTGSGDAKCLIIHFQSAEARDACCNGIHAKFPDLLFHPHDPRQLRVDQKAARRQFVAMLSQLPPNTKDIHLAPLSRDLGVKTVNVLLSMNSYKPKCWAYVTFSSQELMDAAMKQTIGFHGNVLTWVSLMMLEASATIIVN